MGAGGHPDSNRQTIALKHALFQAVARRGRFFPKALWRSGDGDFLRIGIPVVVVPGGMVAFSKVLCDGVFIKIRPVEQALDNGFAGHQGNFSRVEGDCRVLLIARRTSFDCARCRRKNANHRQKRKAEEPNDQRSSILSCSGRIDRLHSRISIAGSGG